jgi:hypothetical protein
MCADCKRKHGNCLPVQRRGIGTKQPSLVVNAVVSSVWTRRRIFIKSRNGDARAMSDEARDKKEVPHSRSLLAACSSQVGINLPRKTAKAHATTVHDLALRKKQTSTVIWKGMDWGGNKPWSLSGNAGQGGQGARPPRPSEDRIVL